MSNKLNYNHYCNAYVNQYMFFVAIFSAIISEEIEDDESLGILGSFLIALGEELALASELRIFCKAKIEEENVLESETLDIFDRSYIKRKKKIKKSIKNRHR